MILEKNRKSEKKKKEKLGIIGLLHRSIGNPRRGVDLRQGVGYLAAARPRCQNGTPQVRHGVALLRHGVATVHSEQIFGFLFSSISYSYTDSLRTLINY